MQKLSRLLLALIFFVAIIPSASAGKVSAFNFANTSGGTGQTDYPLEQYNPYPLPSDQSTWIVNPLFYKCAWDINDHSTTTAGPGYLDPGKSSSVDTCMISYSDPVYSTVYGSGPRNTDHGFYGLSVISSAPTLNVSICYQPQSRCFSLNPIASGIRSQPYQWTFCGQAYYNGNPLDPALAEIPGSRGAYGLVTNITASVRNTGLSRVKTISAGWGVSSDIFYPPGCSDPTPYVQPPGAFRDYPFVWVQS